MAPVVVAILVEVEVADEADAEDIEAAAETEAEAEEDAEGVMFVIVVADVEGREIFMAPPLVDSGAVIAR